MKTTTTEKISKEVQDYSYIGTGKINTYTKTFIVSDGTETWVAGRINYFTFEVGSVESKKYSRRGNAVSAMFKASAKETA